MLRLEGVNAYYGSSQALFDLSLEVRQGEVVGLLGRNGSGKTTTLRSILGLVALKAVGIWFRDRQINGIPPHMICRLGIGYVPEERRIFPDLTVEENLQVAARKPASRASRSWNTRQVYELFPTLGQMRDRKGGRLSGGEQQMLTIGRSLMTSPELMLVDEPVEGLAPVVIDALTQRLLELKREGLTMIVSEQNLNFVNAITNRVYVIDRGEVKYEGSARSLTEDEDLRRRHLTV